MLQPKTLDPNQIQTLLTIKKIFEWCNKREEPTLNKEIKELITNKVKYLSPFTIIKASLSKTQLDHLLSVARNNHQMKLVNTLHQAPMIPLDPVFADRVLKFFEINFKEDEKKSINRSEYHEIVYRNLKETKEKLKKIRVDNQSIKEQIKKSCEALEEMKEIWFSVVGQRELAPELEKLLREKNKNPDLNLNRISNELLFMAAKEGYIDIVKYTLQKGVDPSIGCFEDNGTPFLIAAEKGHTKIIEILLNSKKEDPEALKTLINKPSKYGTTPLLAAIATKHIDIVKILLENGADLNVNSGFKGSLLHVSMFQERIEIVKLLMEKRADPIAGDFEFDMTPLYMAAVNNRIKMAEILLKSKKEDPDALRALINKPSKAGVTPLSTAAMCGHIGIVKLLLENGADSNMGCFVDHVTPLHRATYYGHINIVKLLLKNGADPNVSCFEDGRTPLYIAVQKGYIEMVKLILYSKKNDANALKILIDQPLKNGRTSLFIAIQKGYVDIVKLLLKNGADPNVSRCIDPTSRIYPEISTSVRKWIQIQRKIIDERSTKIFTIYDLAAEQQLKNERYSSSAFFNLIYDQKSVSVLEEKSEQSLLRAMGYYPINVSSAPEKPHIIYAWVDPKLHIIDQHYKTAVMTYLKGRTCHTLMRDSEGQGIKKCFSPRHGSFYEIALKAHDSRLIGYHRSLLIELREKSILIEVLAFQKCYNHTQVKNEHRIR